MARFIVRLHCREWLHMQSHHLRLVLNAECDQKILSRKESSGTVYSPNWPLLYTASVVCKYFIYGLEDAQHLERVGLTFEKVDINASDAECSDAFLKVYLQVRWLFLNIHFINIMK